MAFVRSGKSAGGGGGLVKTTLWTNSNPSAGMGEVTLTLSDSASNYDYIGIKYQGRVAYTPTREYDVIFPIETWNNSSTSTTDTAGPFNAAIGYNYSGFQYRTVQRVSDTSVKVSKRGTYSDAACAPLEIYGLKIS